MLKYKDLDTVSMMVGLPGSGKTSFAAGITKWCLKQRKDPVAVFSNVPILGAYQISWVKDFGKFSMNPCRRNLLIIDEAGLEVDNRSWEKNFDKDKVSFLKLLRHYSCKMIVFSQTWNDCDIKIRSMVGKLFIVKQSLFPFTSVAIPVFRRIDVDEDTHEFKELYYKDNLFFRLFSCRRLLRPLYYKMFDSWDCPKLPVKEYNIYEKEV